MNIEKTVKNLQAAGYSVHVFDTGADAAAWLNQQIDGKTVGIGGSATVKALGLYDLLKTDVYLSSANALAETGEIVNIDGKGNRVASTLFGHDKVYFVIGQNKITETYEDAVWRARNVAAPKRAAQFNVKTPCVAAGAERCFSCKSPERVCRAMVTLWGPMMGTEAEVVLIREDFGL